MKKGIFKVEFTNYLGERTRTLFITDKNEEDIKNHYSYADKNEPNFIIVKLR